MDLIKTWLGKFNQKFTITTDPLLLYQAVSLNPKEAFIASRIHSTMSIEEILSLGGLSEAETLKTICGLVALGIVEPVEQSKIYKKNIKEAKESRTSAAGKAKQAEASAQSASKGSKSPDFNFQSAAAFCYEVENTLRMTEHANYYAVLGIERGTTTEEVKQAYKRLYNKFHPDRNAQLANYNISLRSELEKLSARIEEAYRVLSDPKARSVYDSNFRTSGKIKIPSVLNDKRRR
jgi:hypothetical protein